MHAPQMTTSASTPPNAQTSVEHRHLEGWAQYYEYFHKLNADMQVPNHLPAGASALCTGSAQSAHLPVALRLAANLRGQRATPKVLGREDNAEAYRLRLL